MRIPSNLRSAALAEFKRGGNWQRFINEHGDVIREAEPYNREKFHRLRSILLGLVVAGNNDGQFAPGDDDAIQPWERDDLTEGDSMVQTLMFDTADQYA